jgi:hypothetical protein
MRRKVTRRRAITYTGLVALILILTGLLGLLNIANIGLNIGILVEQDNHHVHTHGQSNCDDRDPCTEDFHQEDYCDHKPFAPGHRCDLACCADLPEDDEEAMNQCEFVPNAWPRCTTCQCHKCAGTCDGENSLDCPVLTINGTVAEPNQNPDQDCDHGSCIYSLRFDTTSQPNLNNLDLPCHKDHLLYINACRAFLNATEDIVADHCLEVVPVCGELTFPGDSQTNLGNSELEACVYYFSCSVPRLGSVLLL